MLNETWAAKALSNNPSMKTDGLARADKTLVFSNLLYRRLSDVIGG